MDQAVLELVTDLPPQPPKCWMVVMPGTIFKNIYFYGCSVCLHDFLCTKCVQDLEESKRVHPLNLELQLVVKHLLGMWYLNLDPLQKQ